MTKRVPWWILKGVQNPSKNPEVRIKISKAMKGNTPWNKGKTGVYTEEAIEKMSEKAIERWKDPDYKIRMSESFKGCTPWNKGKKGVMPEPWNKGKTNIFSNETLRRMSRKRKGRTPWNKGLSYKAPYISEAMKGIFAGEKNPNYGKHHSLETRKILSEKAKKRFENPENHPCYGKHLSDEHKAKLRKARMSQIIPYEYTSIERAIEAVLEKLGVLYIHSFNLGDRFLCDFAVPSSKLIIECDGDYWHSFPRQIKRDKSKDAYAKKCGWNVLRLPEHKINDNIELCETLILNEIGGPMQ